MYLRSLRLFVVVLVTQLVECHGTGQTRQSGRRQRAVRPHPAGDQEQQVSTDLLPEY